MCFFVEALLNLEQLFSHHVMSQPSMRTIRLPILVQYSGIEFHIYADDTQAYVHNVSVNNVGLTPNS